MALARMTQILGKRKVSVAEYSMSNLAAMPCEFDKWVDPDGEPAEINVTLTALGETHIFYATGVEDTLAYKDCDGDGWWLAIQVGV